MICVAKPIAKDCDGRTLLGKKHSFEQNNRKNESSLTTTRTRTVTSTHNHHTSMHRRDNNSNNNINTTGKVYISNKDTSPVTINTADIPSKSNGIRVIIHLYFWFCSGEGESDTHIRVTLLTKKKYHLITMHKIIAAIAFVFHAY